MSMLKKYVTLPILLALYLFDKRVFRKSKVTKSQ